MQLDRVYQEMFRQQIFVQQHLEIESVVYEHYLNVVLVDVEMLVLDTHVEHRMQLDQENPFRKRATQ
jgi:hypothetical protein